jgi:menaquinone-dependent protoporphyrinogen oxidase
MRVAVFFATREGHTRKVSEHIAANLRSHGVDVDLNDVRAPRSSLDWEQYETAWVAASVHAGQHEREMIRFVREHRTQLERLNAVFVSVSLSQAGAEDVTGTATRREAAAADVRRMIDVFVRKTEWHPAHILPVAGALAYSRYNLLVRFVMKRIARSQGAPTDTSRDYEFTNWETLDRFVDSVARRADEAAQAKRVASA